MSNEGENSEVKWLKIYETADAIRAEMLKQILEEAEIEVVLINKKDTMYNIGEVEIYVTNTKAFQAHHLISKNEFKP